MKKIAVVITCYNYERYVARSIQSCLDQTLPANEIVIVNDGSTDGSAEIIRDFARNDSRIINIEQENKGQTVSKNVGISNSSAEFVAFLDADDFWEKDKLEKQMELFQDSQVGVVFSRSRYVDEDNREVNLVLKNKYLQPRRGRVSEWLFMDNFVPFSSSIVRRACFDALGMFDERLKMGIDWDLWLRFSTAYTFDFVDEPLLVYRVGHPGQMSKNLEERMRSSDWIMENFMTRFPDAVSEDVQRQAQSYTCNNRGDYFSRLQFWRALSFYLRSIRLKPLQKPAYGGLVKMVLRRLAGRA